MKLLRTGSVVWVGNLKQGRGAVSTQSKALAEYPYAYASRVEGVRGTNPEELLAAAHAGCFTMGLVMILESKGKTAQRIETQAQVVLEQTNDGYLIPSVHLITQASVPGLDAAEFAALASQAEKHCPVSRLFRAEITLDAKLLPS